MISKEEVRHVAKLARLSLTDKEIEKMQRELSSILDYVDKLEEVDVEKVESFSVKLRNVFRKDLVEGQKSLSESQKLVEMAPETKAGYFKVKSILK